jgi:hypothetical protein
MPMICTSLIISSKVDVIQDFVVLTKGVSPCLGQKIKEYVEIPFDKWGQGSLTVVEGSVQLTS